MASKSASPCEDYCFVDSPLKDYFCPVTFAVLLEPYQTRCCGNHLSKEAYQRLQGKPCPVCKDGNLLAMDDKYLKRKVMSLKVRCPHKAEGCEWEGELGSLEQHLNTNSCEGECQYMDVDCPYACGERVQRRNVEEHKSQHCPLRPFTCQYCNLEATHQKVTVEHWPVCEKYPLPCPNECGEEEMERQHLKGHLEQTCPLEEIKCEFSYAGCGAQLQRRLMSAHIKENMEPHFLMMSQEFPKLRERNCQLEDKIKQQGDQIKKHGDQIKKHGDLMKNRGDLIKQQEKKIKQQAEQLKQKEDQIKQQGEQLKQQAGLIEQQEKHKKQLGYQTESLACIPPVVIFMGDFKKHKNSADVWFSPPFYSHRGGYKMCLRVHASGSGGEGGPDGTYVSVFAYLMKGEFDDNLKWPFCGDITVQLQHLQNSSKTHTKVIPMNQSTLAEARKRPSAERNHWGLGIHSYIFHKELYDGGYNCRNILKFCVSEVMLL